MKGKRFKEEQVIRLLQEAESGLTAADVSGPLPPEYNFTFGCNEGCIPGG